MAGCARADHPNPGWARTHQDLHLRSGRAGLPPHPQAPGPLPHRLRGRISHLKRGYGLRRSRLRGDQGQRIWTGWAVLAYNLDTLAIQAA
ncbi:MAG TPA: hypothetical protein VGW74_17100 [Propionibacteriaceae bacterium]|nr:hypothetical protein [Propionibacteriaceae bacterium]